MLKTKHMVILGAAVVILAVLALVQKAGHERSTSRPATTVLVEGEWTRDDLARIALGYGGDAEAVVLEQAPERWEVATAWHAAASDQRIDGLLRVLGGLMGEFRSDDAAVLADYGLSDESAVTIRAWDRDDNEVIALDVGARPERAQGNFARLPGESAVYITTEGVLSTLGIYGEPKAPEGRHFLALEAVKEDRNDVDSIELVDADGARTLTKRFAETTPAEGDTTSAPSVDRLTWEWELTAPRQAALAKTRADGVLSAVTTVRAVDVDDPGSDLTAYGLAEPVRTATLVFADGHRLDLRFGAERAAEEGRPGGLWMQVGDDPTVWVVTTYAANNIFKSIDDLLPDS